MVLQFPLHGVQIRDAQEYVQMLEEQLHERANQIATMAMQQQPPAHPAGPQQAPASAPASPMQGTVACSTTLNVPPTHSGQGVHMCHHHSSMTGDGGRGYTQVAAAGHHVHHGPELPQHASLQAFVQPVATSRMCACGNSECVRGRVARMPLVDTANMPAVQPGACVHHHPPRVPACGYYHSHSMAPTRSVREHATEDHAAFAKDVFSGRYRSTSLMRMQRLQDRLKASERDLSYRLGRLLGGEADVPPGTAHVTR